MNDPPTSGFVQQGGPASAHPKQLLERPGCGTEHSLAEELEPVVAGPRVLSLKNECGPELRKGVLSGEAEKLRGHLIQDNVALGFLPRLSYMFHGQPRVLSNRN